MPNIDLIPEVLYSPLDPYHFYFDNLPLVNILARIHQVNSQVDIDAGVLRNSVGTQGTLSNRLAHSINPDGTLVASAVDEAMHSVGAHTDGAFGGVNYVRMKKAESDKLALVADGATSVKVRVTTDDTHSTLFSSGTVEFQNSPGVTWGVTGGNVVKANLNFPTNGLRRGYYDQQPVSQAMPSDYQNYDVATVSTPYIDGTLRVNVNGVRMSEDRDTLVPIGAVDSSVPTRPTRSKSVLAHYTSSAADGSFSLSAPITSYDTIRVDFDVPYVTGMTMGSGGGGTGAQGAQGAAGPQGVAGAAGPQGAQGSNTGITGPQGVAGAAGPQGAQGSSTGSPGPQGAAGPQGAQGPGVGSPGPQGAQGAQGSSGGGAAHGSLWLNATDFGAAADNGGTDNRVAFQAAVDYAMTLIAPGSSNKVTIQIPSAPGTYQFGGPVYIDGANIEIVGDGRDETTLQNVSKNPGFMFGVPRAQKVDSGGTFSDLVGNTTVRPDCFGKLDASAASSTGVKWGLRTNSDSVVQFQSTPLSVGVSCAYDNRRSDNWTETSKLTIEFCAEGFVAGYPIICCGNANYDPAPFGFVMGNSGHMLFTFRTSEMTQQSGDPNREFSFTVAGSGPYRVAVQVDLDNVACSAFVNGTQVALTSTSNLTGGSTVPFVAGKKFIVNDHYPLMIGGAGLIAPYGLSTNTDLKVYGFRMSNSVRYQTNGVGTTQVRTDSPGTALNDAWAYFGSDSHTIAFLPFTDNPATSGRAVTVQHGGATQAGVSMGMIMHTYDKTPVANNGLRDLTILGSTHGQLVCVGYAFGITLENLRVSGGHHAIGSFPIGSSYPVYIAGENVLSGFDCAYFGAVQLVQATDRTEFPDSGRVTTRFAGCNVDWQHVLLYGPQPITEGFFKARNASYGGNIKLEEWTVDYEGYEITGAAFFCEAHQQAAATSLVMRDVYLGTVGSTAVLIRLKDTGIQSGGLGRAYLNVMNFQAQTSNYAAIVEVDGPLWHGTVTGGALSGPQLINLQKWGSVSHISFVDL